MKGSSLFFLAFLPLGKFRSDANFALFCLAMFFLIFLAVYVAIK